MTRAISILLVEDLIVIQHAARTVLSQCGAHITIAETGAEAITKFKKHSYDLVLMDIGLPDTSGIEVAKAFRAIEKETGKHTPIVTLTANQNLDDHPSYLEAGMDSVQIKPLTLKNAQVIIDKYVHTRA